MSDYYNIDLHKIARAALKQYGFDFTIGNPVLDEVTALDPDRLLNVAYDGLRDLRGLLWSSIDNAESLDLDQIEYCERGTNGEIIVKIAIADVDLFVPKNSQTDIYAAHNGSSVYAGIDVFPMLPERLSSGLTSLLPDTERAAIVIEFSVLSDGTMTSGVVYRALIRNKAKLIYEEIGGWMEGERGVPVSVTGVPGLREQLELQDEAAERLNKLRVEQGALEFGTVEPKPVIRGDDVVALSLRKKNRASFIIENFMIAANVTVSQFLKRAEIPMIQRVVRVPNNWPGIRSAAAAFDETLPLQPEAKALAGFLHRIKASDPDKFPDLSLAIVKLLGPGEYVMLDHSSDPVGHFGLAVMDYTHGTAPNRRYVDVLIQRLVKAVVGKRPCPYDRDKLADFAVRCTVRDKAAKKVERFMRKAAAAVFLEGKVGESFEGIVTGASEKGTYVRILTPPVEGRIMRGEKGLAVGEKVRVRLAGMNPYKGQIDFESFAGTTK
ncbi:MAG: RNB domain-containing ribonuclease [Candidatus Omnitrophota bacterium]